jgi:hypothetical protein
LEEGLFSCHLRFSRRSTLSSAVPALPGSWPVSRSRAERISSICLVGQMLDADELLARRVDRAEHLVELGLHRGGVAILAVLDQEDHQEGDDRRPVLMISCQVSE